MGLLQWPKNLESKLTITSTQRASSIIYASLYAKDSKLRTATGRRIGRGLFSNIKINPDTIICKFQGEIISDDEYVQRVTLGNGGYAIQLTTNKVLDCYNNCMEGLCKASYANSSHGMLKPN